MHTGKKLEEEEEEEGRGERLDCTLVQVCLARAGG